MAHMAKGDLLIIAGDDVKVITPSWDKELEFYRTKFKILKTQLYFPLPVGHDLYRIHHTREYKGILYGTKFKNNAPIIHKQLYKLLSHISLNAHTDSWLEYVSQEAKIEHPVNIRYILSNVDRNLKAKETRKIFCNKGTKGQMNEDVASVINYVKSGKFNEFILAKK